MGIGTATPVTALQVNAPTDNGVYIGSGTVAGSYPSWLGTNGLYVQGAFRANGYYVDSGTAINCGASQARISGFSPNTGSDINLSFSTGRISAFGERMRITDHGFIGIGTVKPKEMLSVNGNISSRQVKVEVTNWPDYVFKKNYDLLSLSELEAYIGQHRHLPEVPFQQEIEKEGLNVGEMNKILLKKVEELTLHLIRQQKEIDALKAENLRGAVGKEWNDGRVRKLSPCHFIQQISSSNNQ